jgi:hypothetical protein
MWRIICLGSDAFSPNEVMETLFKLYFSSAELRLTCLMSEISVNVPDSIMQGLQAVIREKGINLEQFVNSAIAEKLSAFMSEEYLQERAKRGSREKFLTVLDRTPE